MPAKPKCSYWDNCFRKDKTHLSDFLHPADVKASAEEDAKAPLRKSKTLELEDENAGAGIDAKPAADAPGKLNKRKTHEMSVYEDEATDEPPVKKVKGEEKVVKKAGRPPKGAKGPGGKRKRCHYWEKCFRKDVVHKQRFVHPGDPDENDSEEVNTRASGRPLPLNRMEIMDTVKVAGFTLKRTGSAYECTCSSFSGIENMGKSENQKTCSHLMGHLGEDFERIRCKLPVKGKVMPVPQHINVSVLLAHKYTEGEVDPTGWWMSEKLDGVRAYWNGRCFYSRLGNAFHAPSWFTQHLPKDMHLDGELFGGRKKFQFTVKVVKNPGHADWNKLLYHVFDAPHLEKQPFEMRTAAIKDCFDKAKPGYAKLVDHEKCWGQDHINKEMNRIIALGGEGLMIRKPGSQYERTRSKTLLKIKKFHDAEAVVVGHEPSKANRSQTGALWVQMESGKKFKVGSGMNNKDRRNPPKIGTIITYKFQEYTNSGTPRFPSYLGVRIDMDKPKDAVGVVILGQDD